MVQKREIVCQYAGCDDYGNVILSEKKLENHQEWCEKGITCNRPRNLERDELGLYELEERQRLNFILLKEWNTWLRSPYCQCRYSSGHQPATEFCKSCGRPMNPESTVALDSYSVIDSNEYERIRRLRAGSTWVPVYENTVRAAELALKLLIVATVPAPKDEIPVAHGKHNLRDLWNQVPECAKEELDVEIFVNHHFEYLPHTITAMGQLESDPLPMSEQPVFHKFGGEFDSVRYAWDELSKKGLNEVKEMARKWPDPINLYYLHFATEAVLALLQRRPWDIECKAIRWDRRVQVALGLDDSTYHTDWPSSYIQEEPIMLKVTPREQSG